MTLQQHVMGSTGDSVPVALQVALWRLAVTSLLCWLSGPTSTTWVCSKGAHHFTEYLGPTGTRLLMSGAPLVDTYGIHGY